MICGVTADTPPAYDLAAMVEAAGVQRSALRAGRREALLDAAIGVVRTDGPRASMEALAAAGGVTKPILYRHFGDRDGLVAAIAERFLSRLGAAIDAALASWDQGDPQGVLRTSIDGYLSLVEEDNHLYRFLVQHDARTGNHTTSDFVRRVSEQVADVLRSAFVVAERDPGNAELWAHAIVGMVHAAGDWWAEDQTMSRTDVVAAVTALAWSGLDGTR